ncbi:lactate utilization protein C [Nocardioides sp. ChNu-153]|uniref:LutC/YkgG family protein n=1 Tax=unclassified Nocardioides TaxID=2615069 RepID=UPI00240576D7|nr:MULTISPECIES: lactate utilization protein C [unclassified Nocardioides]MDF9714988.1 lactate utilization protein C [Nocardioides sp. ChNu-99]MDN7122415.1 lactate utilization protein C [Nocardioides sp. ChNu-153]
MSARDEILGRVRSALAGVERTREVPDAPRVPAYSPQERLDLFVERVEDYKAVVERCSPAEVGERVLAAVRRHAGPAALVVVPPDLDPDVVAALSAGDVGTVVDAPGAPLSALELDDTQGVVTAARVGIAETGTIVLDHAPDQGRRAISLVPDLHVCLVRADQVVDDVPDAVALLDPARPATWISGPSATSDIELDRVEGVHGPRTLHVLLVG